jgi:hypothetical protein
MGSGGEASNRARSAVDQPKVVWRGLDPRIHALVSLEGVDGRAKPGQDETENRMAGCSCCFLQRINSQPRSYSVESLVRWWCGARQNSQRAGCSAAVSGCS